MMFTTHIVFALFSGLLFLNFFPIKEKWLFLVFVIASSFIPDIDHPRAKLGRKVKLVAFLFKHRGFFHSMLFLALLEFLLLFSKSNLLFYSIILGISSHILLDALTRKGIMPFYPLTKFRIRGYVETNALAEKIIFIILVIGILCLALGNV